MDESMRVRHDWLKYIFNINVRLADINVWANIMNGDDTEVYTKIIDDDISVGIAHIMS